MKQHLLLGLGVIVIVSVSFYLFSAGRVAAPEESIPEIITENENSTSTTATTTEEKVAVHQETKTTSVSPTPVTAAPAKPKETTRTPDTQTSVSLPYSVTVIYNGGRFIPDEVTIVKGGTVRFYNKSDEDMWIASNPHPTHTYYPEKDDSLCNGQVFDQCTAVSTGNSWSFTFDRIGTWGYHNHERAQDTGKIRVMTAEAYREEMESGI